MSGGKMPTPPLGLGATINALNALSPESLASATLTAAQREALHAALDRVLDQREQFSEQLAPVGPNYLSQYLGLHQPSPEADKTASEALQAALALVVAALGPVRTRMLPQLGDTERQARLSLWIWLNRLSRLLPSSDGMFGGSKITFEQLLGELEDLDVGDQGAIFAAVPRKPGQKARQGRLARLRLKALGWERYLRSQGDSPGIAQAKVSAAYGHSWNTIEKWRKRVCIPLLGEWRVQLELSFAERGQPPTVNWLLAVEEVIAADAQEYRSTLAQSKARAR